MVPYLPQSDMMSVLMPFTASQAGQIEDDIWAVSQGEALPPNTGRFHLAS